MKKNKPLLLFRVDANTSIGSGHVMRCLSLAMAWKKLGGKSLFLCAEIPETLKMRLLGNGIKVETFHAFPGSDGDAEITAHRAFMNRARWIVLDGYAFDPGYLDYLHRLHYKILLLDDFANRAAYPATAVLNQNAHASKKEYPENIRKVFCGLAYVLLRPEFLKIRNQKTRPDTSSIKHVLITLGGSDPVNATGLILQSLKKLEDKKIHVKAILGDANPHFESLKRSCANIPYRLELLRNIKDMPELMRWADIAFSAGGSTCWELACMGTPNITGILADHQVHVAKSVESLGAGFYLGDYRKISPSQIVLFFKQVILKPDRLRQVSNNARNLVDAQGAARVAGWMMERYES